MALNKIKKISPLSHAVAIGSMALLLAACGDNVTEVTEVTQVVGMQVVEKGDDLPRCTTDNEGQMVYSVDSAAAYYCINRKWTSMKGEDGADGKDGKDGKNGTNGTNGKNGSDGASCTAVEIDDGYKIVCGKDSVGVVLNGANGDKGEKGKDGDNGNDGEKGSDGTSCTAEAIDGGYKIVCGDDSVGVVLNGKDGADGKSFVDGWMVDPRDKQLYRVVTIGEQTWMAENLNYKVDSSFCYNDSVEYCEKYGRLYQWAAAVGKSEEECGYGKTCGLSGSVRGVCPEGWHLPDTTEWNTLFTAVGGSVSAGKKLKSQTGWVEDYNGSDAYGFSVLPAGYYKKSSYKGLGIMSFIWSAIESDYEEAYAVTLALSPSATWSNVYKNAAYSVRCIKD